MLITVGLLFIPGGFFGSALTAYLGCSLIKSAFIGGAIVGGIATATTGVALCKKTHYLKKRAWLDRIKAHVTQQDAKEEPGVELSTNTKQILLPAAKLSN